MGGIRAQESHDGPAKQDRQAGVAAPASPRTGHDAVLHLQRSAGNAATSRMLSRPTVQRKPEIGDVLGNLSTKTEFAPNTERVTLLPPTTNIMDPKVFRELTRTTGHQRSTAQVAIEEYLAAYAEITAGDKDALERKRLLLLQMRYAAEQWMLDHTALDDDDGMVRRKGTTKKPVEGPSGTYLVDPKRKKRFAGMQLFHTRVGEELVSVETLWNNAKHGQLETLGTFETSGKTTDRHKKIKDRYEGDPTSTLTKLGALIDLAVPKAGDTSEIEIAFRWPVDPNGVAFIGGTVRAAAENGSSPGDGLSQQGAKNVTARVELVFTFGAQFLNLAKIQGEIGGYMEGSAPTGRQVMTLMSYGMYRRAVESFVFPQGVINYLWGGRSGVFGQLKAEKWSKDVETSLLNSDKDGNAGNYVESGMTAGVGIDVGKKLSTNVSGEFSAGITFTRGTRYDPKSIKDVKGGAGRANTRHDKANLSGAQSVLGRRTMSLGFEFAASVGPFSGDIGVSLHWQSPEGLGSKWATGTNAVTLTSLQIGGSLGASVPNVGGDALGERIAGWSAEGVKTIVSKVRGGLDAKQDQLSKALTEKQKGEAKGATIGGEVMSSAIDGLEQLINIESVSKALTPNPDPPGGWLDKASGDGLGNAMGQHTTAMTETFGEGGKASLSKAWENRSMDSTIGLKLHVGGDPIQKRFQIAFSMDKEREFSVPLFLDISQSSSTRLVAFIYEDGKWSVQ